MSTNMRHRFVLMGLLKSLNVSEKERRRTSLIGTLLVLQAPFCFSSHHKTSNQQTYGHSTRAINQTKTPTTMEKKTNDDTVEREMNSRERETEASGATANEAMSESSTRQLSRVGPTDAAPETGMNARNMQQTMPGWQAMHPSMINPAVPLHQMMPSSFPAADGNAQLAAFNPSFVPPSLAGSDGAVPSTYMDLAALNRSQQGIQRGRDRGGGLVHSSVAASSLSQSQSSTPDQEMVTQQQQMIYDSLLASMAAANPYIQAQLALSATLPGVPSMNGYQSALSAASSGFFPQGGASNIPGAPFFQAGLPPNMTGFEQNLPIGGTTLPANNLNVPDASHYAALRGGSINQRADVINPTFSQVQRPPGTHPAMTGVTRGILEPFPERLHRLLSEVEAAGLSDIVSFTEDGQAFKIHKPDEFFRKIVNVYFKQTRLSSFKRQLNLCKHSSWLCRMYHLAFFISHVSFSDGFELIDHGKFKGGYYHEMFMRGEPGLARQIRRVDSKYGDHNKHNEKKAKKARYASSTPDFYSMPPILSSEEAEKKLAASRSSDEAAKRDSGSNSSDASNNKMSMSESSNPRKRKSSDEDEEDRKPSANESAT